MGEGRNFIRVPSQPMRSQVFDRGIGRYMSGSTHHSHTVFSGKMTTLDGGVAIMVEVIIGGRDAHSTLARDAL
jgi:hypothetical protein